MLTKNISVRIKKNHEVPFHETYVAIRKSSEKYIFTKNLSIRRKTKRLS